MECKISNCFSKNLIEGVLKQALTKVKDSSVKFTNIYELDLGFMICGYALHRYEALIQRARKQNDPNEYFKDKKETYYSILETQYMALAQSKRAARVLCSLLRESMVSSLNESMPIQIANSMKTSSNVFNTKKSLKVKILTSLAEKEDLDLFFGYLENVKASIKHWIRTYIQEHCSQTSVQGEQTWIESEVLKLWGKSVAFIIDIVESIQRFKSVSSFGVWVKKFQERITSQISLSAHRIMTHTSDLEVSKDNIKDFEMELVGYLKEMKCDIKKIIATDLKTWEDKALECFNDIVGCCEQCPFCAEQCDLLFPNHESDGVDHSVELHRPQCLAKYRWETSKEIMLEICTTSVDGGCRFRNADTKYEWHPYKEYRKFYPKWKITPDPSISASSYWKWFVSKYSSEISKRYNAKENTIPEDWKKITKQQILTDVKKIEMKIA